MNCPKCRGEVARGSPKCPHCGVKFVVRPKPNEIDQMWGDEPAKPDPPPPAPPPRSPGRVLSTGRPSTIGTNILADNIKAVAGIALTALVVLGFGIRTCIRWKNRTANAQWQTVENSEVTIKPGGFECGKVNSEIEGSYQFDVVARDRNVRFGIRKIAGTDPTQAELDALTSSTKPVAAGSTETLTGSIEKGTYVWVVSNDTDQPAHVRIVLKGIEK